MEPAADLAVCCSIASSFKDKSPNEGFAAIGEVGLGGEIRGVSQIEKRIQEAEKLGLHKLIFNENNERIWEIYNYNNGSFEKL